MLLRLRPDIIGVALVSCFGAGCYGSSGGAGDGSGDGSDTGFDASDVDVDDAFDGSAADATDAIESDSTPETDADVGDPTSTCNPACVYGACVLEPGNAPYCACDEGWTGDACDACVSGQDNDGDGVCTVACGEAGAPECGAAFCHDDSGTAACGCPRGLVLVEAGDACELGRWPYNGDFRLADGWTLSGSASIETDAHSTWHGTATGVVRFVGAEACSQTSTASQNVPFSGVSWETTGYSVDVQSVCDFETGISCPGPRIWVNGRLANVNLSESNIDDEAFDTGCLPVSAAGSDLDLVLAATIGDACGAADTMVDLVSIRESDGWFCPIVPGIRDGGFDRDLDTGAWRNVQNATIEDVLGDRVLALRGGTCDIGSADQVISLDDDVANPAMLADIQIPEGRRLMVFDANGGHAYHAGDTSVALCLDPGIPLTRQSLSFRAEGEAETCEMGPFDPVYIDNVRVVDEPSCANIGGVTAGSFDGVGAALWRTYAFSMPANRASASIYAPEEGTSLLRLTGGTDCYQSTASLLIGGPNAAPNGALRFDYRVLRGETNLTVEVLGRTTELVGTPLWQTHEQCLVPWSAYTVSQLEFAISDVSACSGTPSELSRPTTVEFDNVEIVSSDGCL